MRILAEASEKDFNAFTMGKLHKHKSNEFS